MRMGAGAYRRTGVGAGGRMGVGAGGRMGAGARRFWIRINVLCYRTPNGSVGEYT